MAASEEDKVSAGRAVHTVLSLLAKPDAPALLPTCGAGFGAFTGYPKIIAADKTQYIEELDKEPMYQYLFLRPRRFGKSTFLQTLSNYYDKSKAGQFEDTFCDFYIGKNRTTAASSLLVLCFDPSRMLILGTAGGMEAQFHTHIYTTLEMVFARQLAIASALRPDKIARQGTGGCLWRMYWYV